MSYPVLYQFTASHFSEKVRWALDFKGIPHVRRSLMPGFHLPQVWWMSGQTALPVLRLGGQIVCDSTRIIASLEEIRAAPSLYPRHKRELERALALEEMFDERLAPHVRRLVFHLLLPYPNYLVAAFGIDCSRAVQWACRGVFPVLRVWMENKMSITAGFAESRVEFRACLDRLEEEISPSGYLVGDRFTVADLTAAAFLCQLVAPPEFPYHWSIPSPEPLSAWRTSLADHPATRWAREMYRRHRGTSVEVLRDGRAARIERPIGEQNGSAKSEARPRQRASSRHAR